MLGNKENADGDVRNSTSSFQNKYKRTNRNDGSLQNYQEKYNKLEENFKKFTQGLQDKRNNSSTGRTALTSTVQNSSFGPIKSELSPTRQTKLDFTSTNFQNNLQISRSINPLGMSTINNHVNASNSFVGAPQVQTSQALDKSLAIESLLGHPGYMNETVN